MATTIKLTCPICNKDFDKNLSEYQRQIKKNPNTNFYCGLRCSSIGIHIGKSNPIIKKICPVCNTEFETKTGKYERTFCSRSCASKGSVNDNRRNAGIIAARMNFTEDTHSIYNIQNILKTREAWKYKEIDMFLRSIHENYEFEYILGNYIYDLALFNKKIVVEFDGPDHKYLNELDKNYNAFNYGWRLVRYNVKPNTIISASMIYSLYPIIFL